MSDVLSHGTDYYYLSVSVEAHAILAFNKAILLRSPQSVILSPLRDSNFLPLLSRCGAYRTAIKRSGDVWNVAQSRAVQRVACEGGECDAQPS